MIANILHFSEATIRRLFPSSKKSRSRGSMASAGRLPVEKLEDRIAPAAVVVNIADLTNGSDGGNYTLKDVGGLLVLTDNDNANAQVWDSSAYLTVDSLTINGVDGVNDSLTVDLASGDVVPTGGLTFNGGTGASDALAVTGNTTVDTAVFTPSGTTTGTGSIVLNSGPLTISFSATEALDLSGMLSATMRFPGGNDAVTIANGTSAVGGNDAIVLSGTSGGVGFLSVALFGNGTAIIDTTSVSGNDTITISGANSANHNNGNLTVNAGVGIDTFNVTGDVSVSGNLNFTSGGSMMVDGALSTDLGLGDVTLTAGGPIAVGAAISGNHTTLTAGGTVDFHVAANVGALSVVTNHDANFLSTVTATSGTVTVSSTGGNLSFFGAVSAENGVTASSSSGGDIKFYSSLVANTGSVAVSSAGVADITFSGAVTATAGSLVVTNPGGNVIYYGQVKTSLSGTSHYVQADSLDARSSVTSFDGSIVWEVDNLEISGALSGPDDLIIRPYTASRAINLNHTGDALELTTVELGLIGDGFTSITIGRSNGSGAMITDGFEFRDPLTLLTPNGTLTINGGVVGAASDAPIVIGARFLRTNVDAGVDGAAISTRGAGISMDNVTITLLADTLFDSHADPATTGGDVFIRATINGAHSFEVDALNSSSGGAVVFHGMPNPPGDSSIGGGTRLTSFTASGRTLNIVSDTLTTGDQAYHAAEGITTHSGKLFSFGHGNITLDGDVHSAEYLRVGTGGNIQFNGKVNAVSSTGLIEINAGSSGGITFAGDVTADGSYVPLTNLTIVNAGSVSFAGDVTITNLASIKAGTVDFADSQSVSAKKLIITAPTTTFGSNLTVTESGTISGSVLTFGGNVSATNTLSIKGGTVDFQGANTVGGKKLTITGTSVVFNGNLQPTESAVITANEIDFLGGPGSVSSTGATLTLQTSTAAQAVRVGGTEADVPAALTISTADITALGDGFSMININRLAGTAKLTVEAATFSDAVTFRQYASTGVIEVTGPLQAEAGQADASFTFIGPTNLVSYDDDNSSLTPNVFEIKTDGGNMNFHSAVSIVDDDPLNTNTTPIAFTFASAGGNITFSNSVVNTDTALYHDLTVTSGSGNVAFNGSISKKAGAKTFGAVTVNSSGVTSLNSISAETLTADADGSAILRGPITMSDAASTLVIPEITITGTVELWNSVTLTAKSAGRITLGDVDSRAGKAYSLTLVSQPTEAGGTTGLLTVGKVGQTTPLNVLSATTSANGIALGGDITATKLTLVSKSALADDTYIWDVAGRATLNSATSVTITNVDTAIGEFSLTGPVATVSLTNDVKVVGGKILGSTSLTSSTGTITLSGTFKSGDLTAEASGDIQIAGGNVVGLTDLTSHTGRIYQTGAFQTTKLAAAAENGDILFDTGTLRVAKLGAFTSGGDITILRGAPGNLTFDSDMLIDAAGDVIIVADYGTSKGNVSQAAGLAFSPISAARFLVYAFDDSASTTLNFPGVDTYSQHLRYSAVVSASGNPANIAGTYFVFAQA